MQPMTSSSLFLYSAIFEVGLIDCVKMWSAQQGTASEPLGTPTMSAVQASPRSSRRASTTQAPRPPREHVLRHRPRRRNLPAPGILPVRRNLRGGSVEHPTHAVPLHGEGARRRDRPLLLRRPLLRPADERVAEHGSGARRVSARSAYMG